MHSLPEISGKSPNHLHSVIPYRNTLVEMHDADGIDAVCSAEYSQNGTLLYFAPNSTVTDLDGTEYGLHRGYFQIMLMEWLI